MTPTQIAAIWAPFHQAYAGVAADIKGITAQLGTLANNAITLAQVDNRIAAVVGAAPAALDTLAEIATALQAEQTATGAITTSLAGKASASDVVALADRVDDLEAIFAGMPDFAAAYAAAKV
jgi:hypothetical protein